MRRDKANLAHGVIQTGVATSLTSFRVKTSSFAPATRRICSRGGFGFTCRRTTALFSVKQKPLCAILGHQILTWPPSPDSGLHGELEDGDSVDGELIVEKRSLEAKIVTRQINRPLLTSRGVTWSLDVSLRRICKAWIVQQSESFAIELLQCTGGGFNDDLGRSVLTSVQSCTDEVAATAAFTLDVR